MTPHSTLVFDLDNTLYPASCRLFDQIDVRMTRYVSETLSLSETAARTLQKDYFVRYGTTLSGLMEVHGTRPQDFLRYVHEIDFSPIPANPQLAHFLENHLGEKIIYTNGSYDHAVNVLAALGIPQQTFSHIIDIAATDYRAKPCEAAFTMMLQQTGITPENAIFFDDIPRNLEPAAKAGLTTVWIGGIDNEYQDLQSLSGTPAQDYIHHTVSSVMAYLQVVSEDHRLTNS